MSGGIKMVVHRENSAHARLHILEILLGTAVKNWSQAVMMIQEYCELHYFLFKVILDTLTWSWLYLPLKG